MTLIESRVDRSMRRWTHFGTATKNHHRGPRSAVRRNNCLCKGDRASVWQRAQMIARPPTPRKEQKVPIFSNSLQIGLCKQETLSNTASTATPVRRFCSESGIRTAQRCGESQRPSSSFLPPCIVFGCGIVLKLLKVDR